MYYKIAEIVQ